MGSFGNLIDLKGLIFADQSAAGTQKSWIQAMPLGKYFHPVYGKIDITPEKVKGFADNANNGVRGQQLDIDYDHKEYTGEAAGWVLQTEARLNESNPAHNGLWVLVEWTQKAYEKIKSGAYKYFSPEFEDDWEHPVTKLKYDVLNGGGITNRPFLKGILPLNLSEKFAELTPTESSNMFTDEQRVALIAKFGLDPAADDNAILAALIESVTAAPASEEVEASEDVEQEPINGTAPVGAPSKVTVQFSEAEIKTLSENPLTKKLMEQLADNTKQLKEMRDNSTVAAIAKKFSDKGLGLPPVVEEALTETIKLSDNDRTTAAVIQMLSKIADTGFVQLGETQITKPGSHQVGKKSLSERAEELAKKENISFGDAVVKITIDDPEAYDAHRAGN